MVDAEEHVSSHIVHVRPSAQYLEIRDRKALLRCARKRVPHALGMAARSSRDEELGRTIPVIWSREQAIAVGELLLEISDQQDLHDV